jgi:hypothetical protein
MTKIFEFWGYFVRIIHDFTLGMYRGSTLIRRASPFVQLSNSREEIYWRVPGRDSTSEQQKYSSITGLELVPPPPPPPANTKFRYLLMKLFFL